MPESISVTRTVQVAGRRYEVSLTDAADVAPPFSPTVAAAKTGTLTTRTDNDTGVITADAGHGLTTGNKLDVYWTESSVNKRRLGMTATVATNAITVDGGTGDNLPVTSTALTFDKPTRQDLVFAGDDAVLLALSSPVRGTVRFIDEDGSTILETVELEAGGVWSWTDAEGLDNPLGTGVTVGHIDFTHAQSTAAAIMRGSVAYN